MFFANYAKAHVTLSELGHDNLMGELNIDIEDGGYVENSSTRVHHKLIGEWLPRKYVKEKYLHGYMNVWMWKEKVSFFLYLNSDKSWII